MTFKCIFTKNYREDYKALICLQGDQELVALFCSRLFSMLLIINNIFYIIFILYICTLFRWRKKILFY